MYFYQKKTCHLKTRLFLFLQFFIAFLVILAVGEIILFIVSSVLTILGSIKLDVCPREKYIPIFVLVEGVLGIIKSISSMIQRCLNRNQEKTEKTEKEFCKISCFDYILLLIYFAWFIAGNVWIFRIYNDFDEKNKNSKDYCDPLVYKSAFWSVIGGYVTGVLTIIVKSILLCYKMYMLKKFG